MEEKVEIERAAAVTTTTRTKKKEILVIGAGSAGLVAARHLAKYENVNVTLLERSDRVGGAWHYRDGDDDGEYPTTTTIWKDMSTNLSRFACCYSDHVWDKDDEESSCNNMLFPTRAQMQSYLTSYANKYIDPSCCIRFGCAVLSVKKQDVHDGKYVVQWKETAKKKRRRDYANVDERRRQQQQHPCSSYSTDNDDAEMISREFDGVIVSTGFFTKPVMPDMKVDDKLFQENNNDDNSCPRVIHSAEYRSAADYCRGLAKRPRKSTSTTDDDGPIVAVIGSSFSALEIAADLAPRVGRIVHVHTRIPYVIPRYLPVCSGKSKSSDRKGSSSVVDGYLPVDLALYRRPPGASSIPKFPEAVTLDASACRARHEMLPLYVGPQQRDTLGFPPPEEREGPPIVAISDHYLGWLAQKRIQTIRARLVGVSEAETKQGEPQSKRLVLELERAGSPPSAEELSASTGEVVVVDRVICCTGYQPANLDFLDVQILETLRFHPNDGNVPLELCHDVFHPELPGLAFVGLYKGPFFVAEMQARLAAPLVISGRCCTDYSPTATDLVQRALSDCRTIRNQERPRQFPHYDFIGWMDGMASLLLEITGGGGHGLPLFDLSFEHLLMVRSSKNDTMKSSDDDDDDTERRPIDDFVHEDCARMMTAPLYHGDISIVQRALQDLHYQIRSAHKNLPRVLLLGLLGTTWSFQRTVTAASSSTGGKTRVVLPPLSVDDEKQQTTRRDDDKNNETSSTTATLTNGTMTYSLRSNDGSIHCQVQQKQQNGTGAVSSCEDGQCCEKQLCFGELLHDEYQYTLHNETRALEIYALDTTKAPDEEQKIDLCLQFGDFGIVEDSTKVAQQKADAQGDTTTNWCLVTWEAKSIDTLGNDDDKGQPRGSSGRPPSLYHGGRLQVQMDGLVVRQMTVSFRTTTQRSRFCCGNEQQHQHYEIVTRLAHRGT